MTITLPPELESRLRNEAQRRGCEPSSLAVKLIGDQLLPAHQPSVTQTQSLAELFAQWDAEDATDDPAEIASRNQELEEFKEAMNRNRLEMEGPGARKLFP
jgi:hypothetical protein